MSILYGPPLEMPELYLEMVSTADERWKSFRIEHYIKSYDYEQFKATREHHTLNAKEPAKLGLKIRERGQQIHFLIWYKGEQVGIISGGSVVYGTRLRDEFFKVPKETAERKRVLNSIVNNTVYHLAPREKFLFARALALWEKVVPYVWNELYEVPVCGFETFIDPKGTKNGGRGSGYRGIGWTWLGKTAGNAKTMALPKTVLCKWRPGYSSLIAVDYKPTWEAGEKDKDGNLTPKGAAQRALAKIRTARRKKYIGKFFYATKNMLFVYDHVGAKPKEVLLEVYELIRKLQLALNPALLKPEWRNRAAGEHPTFGHCYAVTEALYYLYGKSRGFTPHVVQVPAMSTTHWWLQNKKGEIIDGTKEQFESKGVVIPYAEGRGSGFLTSVPSKRCVLLMERIGKVWKHQGNRENFESYIQDLPGDKVPTKPLNGGPLRCVSAESRPCASGSRSDLTRPRSTNSLQQNRK